MPNSPMATPASAIAPASISSMTGYARVTVEVTPQLSFTLAIKSVNHRFLDPQFRLPSSLDAIEVELRRLIKEHLLRGHVELTLQLERSAHQRGGYNREIVASYVEAFRSAAAEFSLPGEPDLNTILRIPNAMQGESRSSEEDMAALEAAVLAAMPALLEELKAMRRREGASLAQFLHATLARLTQCVHQVAALRPQVEQRYQQRLTERLQAAIGPDGSGLGVNRQRMLEEIALLVERTDVAEEIARMETHIAHFHEVLSAGGEAGKKLDFLLQEMNREANTLLSKTSG
ncbi:MAG TPA: YicC/YloC family endoribonuclease, partial [Acidobacteriaceae bacterium]